MKVDRVGIGIAVLLTGTLLLFGQSNRDDSAKHRVVRLAELEIDPVHMDVYKAALRQEIETSIRSEPGVLRLDAVSVKDHPDEIRLFEMYANEAAYRSHLESPHFKKYKNDTAGFVKSLKLVETEPILLGSK